MAMLATDAAEGGSNAAYGLVNGEKSEEDVIEEYGMRFDVKGADVHRNAIKRVSQYLFAARKGEDMLCAWPICSVRAVEFG